MFTRCPVYSSVSWITLFPEEFLFVVFHPFFLRYLALISRNPVLSLAFASSLIKGSQDEGNISVLRDSTAGA